MLTYQERLNEVVKILQEAGAILYKEDKILGYSVSTDSLHHTITNQLNGDWDEYPAAHAIFKFGKLDNPRYVYVNAKMSGKEKGSHFHLLIPEIRITNELPGILEDRVEKYLLCNDPVVAASRITGAIYDYEKQNKN